MCWGFFFFPPRRRHFRTIPPPLVNESRYIPVFSSGLGKSHVKVTLRMHLRVRRPRPAGTQTTRINTHRSDCSLQPCCSVSALSWLVSSEGHAISLMSQRIKHSNNAYFCSSHCECIKIKTLHVALLHEVWKLLQERESRNLSPSSICFHTSQWPPSI